MINFCCCCVFTSFLFVSESNPDDQIYFDTLNQVIDNVESMTCIRFTRIDMDNNDIWPYISFQDINGKCKSPVGMRSGSPTDGGKYVNQVCTVSLFIMYSIYVLAHSHCMKESLNMAMFSVWVEI